MTRLETFVDAAFAFAVTLLVISIDNIPDSYDDFIEALLQAPAFLACFLQLMMFWLGHRAWGRRYDLESTPVIWISLGLVAGILIIVYPLRLMFGAAFAYVTGGYIPSEIEFDVEQMRTVFILYGSGFSVLSSLIAMLFWLALSAADSMSLNAKEVSATRSDVQAWMILAFTGITFCDDCATCPGFVGTVGGMGVRRTDLSDAITRMVFKKTTCAALRITRAAFNSRLSYSAESSAAAALTSGWSSPL